VTTFILLLALGCAADDSKDTAGVDSSTDSEDAAPVQPRFVPDAADGGSVERVEPARYLGLWYEIATTPSQQQTACSATTAEYSLIDESTIGVTNRCRLGGLEGRMNKIEGTARPIDDSYARLLVDLGFGFEAPYTVIDLYEPPGDEPYRYATVTASGYQYWILSRTPQMPEDVFATMLERMEERGGDSSRLVLTDQPANPVD
jgi:apolipoprotein D and lipocalin family protein